MNIQWMCNKHKTERINFVCLGNMWHFQPLCNLCIPEHTKNHPKNIKIQMENINDIIPKAMQLKQNLSGLMKERMKRCEDLSAIPQQHWEIVCSLNEKKATFISQIAIFFDSLIEEVKKKRSAQVQQQRQNISKITKQIQEKFAYFKKQEYLDIEIFCNQIKKYYFKDNLEIYVEEIDEVLREYEEKTIKYNPFAWAKDTGAKLRAMLRENVKIQYESESKISKQKQVAPQKKQTKKIQFNKKRCPTCKEQMQYLTEWKKHLVCRNCGNKQRNYRKKA